MARVRSKELREIAAKAKQAAAKQRLENERAAARREGIWKKLFEAAVDGSTECYVESIHPDDAKYLKRMGLRVALDFERTQERPQLVAKHERISRELARIEEELQQYARLSKEQVEQTMLTWLANNADLAFSCGLDEYFGSELDRLPDWEDLPELGSDLLLHIEGTDATDRDEAALRNLLELTEQLDDIQIKEGRKEGLDLRLAELKEEKESIEASPDFTHEASQRQLHRLSWEHVKARLSDCDGSGAFNVQSLAWISSPTGQRSLRELEQWIRSRAEQGKRAISICVETARSGAARAENPETGAKVSFPGVFELEMFFRVLELRVSATARGVALRW